MGLQKKTLALIEAAHQVLSGYNPMTLRQVYYRLVSGQVLKNTRGQYQSLSVALVKARQMGIIPWPWIEDRTRHPRQKSMWGGLPDFAETAVRAYSLDVWGTQPAYLEVWLEKDALSGVFEGVLHKYGIALNVGRGYDGWSSIHGAAGRYKARGADGITVLYFGDFDPSGEDMVRSLRDRLAFFGLEPEVVKIALTNDDVERYQLPPDFTKKTDTRSAAFVERWGDMAVELDALPPDVLETRLRAEVETRMDLDALERVWQQERADRERLAALLGAGGHTETG